MGCAVGGVSLAFKLRGLSAENFVRLLASVFAAVQVLQLLRSKHAKLSSREGTRLVFPIARITREVLSSLFRKNVTRVGWGQSRLVRAAEVRSVIEQIIGGLQGSYAAEAVAAAFASGAAAAAAAEAAQEGNSNSLRSLSNGSSSDPRSLTRANSTASASSISRQFR